jgi:hypothetical protein
MNDDLCAKMKAIDWIWADKDASWQVELHFWRIRLSGRVPVQS